MVATRSRTPVALTSLAGNQFMKAYRIMTPFWARGEGEEEEKRKKRRGEGYCRTQARHRGGGGAVVATRSRTPVAITSQAGNQFMKAYRITTSFRAGEGKRKKRSGKGLCCTQARRIIRSLL